VTFAENYAEVYGGGMFNRVSSNPPLVNSILWGNTAMTDTQIHNQESSLPVISTSDIQGCGGSGPGWDLALGVDGGGNIDEDPRFVDAAGGDLRLRTGSPAVDVGDNSAVAGVTTDLAGWARIINGTVDMGAYETPLGVYLPLTMRSQ
jgi:hypothetical protein